MNTSVIEAIERQKTTNLYDASKSIPDDEIRELRIAPKSALEGCRWTVRHRFAHIS